MWAMMPMFRVRLSGVSLGIEFSFQLPAVSFQLRSYPPDQSFFVTSHRTHRWQRGAGS
jgi:hypothetical protein